MQPPVTDRRCLLFGLFLEEFSILYYYFAGDLPRLRAGHTPVREHGQRSR
jgi:hypothetical protein